MLDAGMNDKDLEDIKNVRRFPMIKIAIELH